MILVVTIVVGLVLAWAVPVFFLASLANISRFRHYSSKRPRSPTSNNEFECSYTLQRCRPLHTKPHSQRSHSTTSAQPNSTSRTYEIVGQISLGHRSHCSAALCFLPTSDPKPPPSSRDRSSVVKVNKMGSYGSYRVLRAPQETFSPLRRTRALGRTSQSLT